MYSSTIYQNFVNFTHTVPLVVHTTC